MQLATLRPATASIYKSSTSKLFQRVDEVVTNFAAHAAVGEVDGVFLDPRNELGVDVDCAKIVDKHADPQAVLPAEDAVQQGRFSGTDTRAGTELVDKSFYVWVSFFALFHVSAFWSFMSDLYSNAHNSTVP